MTIETEFNVGDVAFFIHEHNIKSAKIVSVLVEKRWQGGTNIQYEFAIHSYTTTIVKIPQGYVHADKETLIARISK